ncbi:MAG: FHA domain-containing protein, partial [Kiritimatiellales bacterium]|nr:FHA domain-containing protein [Kiritimatiellales bacterium]
MATLVLYPKTSDSRLIHLDKPSMLIGCTPVADICLESESVSDCHARIEHKSDGYYVISLSNTPGVFVNGVEITFQRLRNGDKIEIGDVTAEFLLADEDTSQYEEAVPREMMLNARPVAGTNALVANSNRSMACPQCGLPLTPGVLSCPRCGQPIATLPMIQMDFIPPTPMSQASSGLLPVIAFLAALTIVGAPVALVLGLITLSIIRRRGGTIRDLTMAKWSIGLGLFWIMIGVVAAGGAVWRIHKRAQLNSVEVYEAQVIRSLKNLACAEKYAHTIEFFDTDSDGYGEYGELSALAKIQSPFFDTDLSDGKAYGYHFTIREASEGQFLAVAEPTHYESTGGRTFAIDQSGQIRGGDSHGNRFGQISSVLPVLQGERSAYYEIDDEIAKDVLNYVKAIPSSPENEEKKQRILMRLRKEYSLTSVGRELEGLESTVNRFVTEQRAQAVYLEAQAALAGGSQDVALAKLSEIQTEHPSFSKIAAVERELIDLRSAIAQRREMEAQDLFTKAEAGERQGMPQQEVQQLFQRIEKLYPDTEVAARITSLKPELQRQLRERNAEELFSDLMELSPESEYEKILSQANQLRRNYSDTDLFGKAEAELTRKERKARASAWRVKTQQNIDAGRMRGALAQLESAIRENPDLQYDLRDLCTQLYREVADKMAEEGDARGALGYYTQADRLLQASNSKDQISQELLAKLHNDVGLADYERKDYPQARWHLASAAWKYQENAQFNMRLGAA